MNQAPFHDPAMVPSPDPLHRRDWMVRGLRWIALGLLLAPLQLAAEDSPIELEYKVKGGYLFNFAKFVEWPASALTPSNTPFVIGVLDGGEALPVLRLLFQGMEVNGRPLEVRKALAEAVDQEIRILFVTRAAGKTPEEIRKFAGSATLLVGETDEFSERGGTIGFVRENERIRLTLCLEHAAESGLKVSAKLASVAKLVKSKYQP